MMFRGLWYFLIITHAYSNENVRRQRVSFLDVDPAVNEVLQREHDALLSVQERLQFLEVWQYSEFNSLPTKPPAQAMPTGSPVQVDRTESPTQVAPTESPAQITPTESPAQTTSSPVLGEDTEAPALVPRTEAPAQVAPTESPVSGEDTEAPAQAPRTESPAQIAPTGSPVLETESPAQVAPTGSPVTTESPAQVSRTESPAQVTPTGSPMPTFCPDSREEALLQTLNEITSSDLLLNETTPQGQAFAWLLNTDTSYSPCAGNIPQRYGLAVLHYNWGNFTANASGWFSVTSECEWQYVTCDPDSRVVVELSFSKF